METDNKIDINHPWYEGKFIAGAGSSVETVAGSLVVVDYSIDNSHEPLHQNVKVRTSPEGEIPKGKDVEKIFGDLHFVEL